MKLRRLYLIANPKGGVGNNERLAMRAREYLERHGIASELRLTEYAGHGSEMVESMAWEEGDAVCGIGGDGTLHELVNGMMGRPESERVPLSLLPGGTGNSFLRDLDGLDPDKVLERLVEGGRRSLDLFEVSVSETRWFGFNVVGWGLFSSANQLAESLRLLGRRRYDVAGLLKILQHRTYDGRLTFDGECLEGGFSLIVISNTVHTGEGMKLAPRARLDDGLLDLLVLRDLTRRGLFKLFAGLRDGTHVDAPEVIYRQVKRVTLETEETLPVNLDGELVAGGSMEVCVRPGCLDFLY